MALTLEEVRRIAALARLRLSPEEEARFVPQLGRIVDYIDQLRNYATAEPAAVPTADREAADQPAPCLPREAFLVNAPEAMGEFLVVPAIKATEDV